MPAATSVLITARTLRRAIIAGTAAATALLLFAAPALAHISVTPDSARAGSASVLTFHVPNEEAHADTVRVDVQIPTDHPIAQFLVKPVPGWNISVRTVTLSKPIVTDDGQFTQAVSEVIWSGGRILPGQFQDFTVSADPLPTGVSQLAFKAIQTYSNGDVVRWIDLPQPGQPPPDHPAPTLTLITATAPAKTASATAAGPVADGTARALAIAGLLVGLIAGLLALVVARRGRRSPAPAGNGAGAPARGDRGSTHGDEKAKATGSAGTAAAGVQNPGPAGTKASRSRNLEPAGTKAAARPRNPQRRGR